MKFDLCIIGGGPAGIAAALRGVNFGKAVCLIEKHRIGGADVWNGSLQSKTLWEMGRMYRSLSTRGRTGGLAPSSARIHQTLQDVAHLRQQQLTKQLQCRGVHLVQGTAEFKNGRCVRVESASGPPMVIGATYFMVATGSHPREHPLIPSDGETILTTDTIIERPLPSSIVIVGAGAVGCEFASIYADFGITDVRIVDKGSRILPFEDDDVVSFVEEKLSSRGVRIHQHASLHSLEKIGGRLRYVLGGTDKGPHEVDCALVAIGRQPNLAALRSLDIQRPECVATDEFGRLHQHDNIYVCGDAGSSQCLHNVAEWSGRAAVKHMFSPGSFYNWGEKRNISSILFLGEEIASVGLNEQQCRSNKFAYRVGKYGLQYVSRAVAMGSAEGFVKLIVADTPLMEVLGIRAVGPQASSIIEIASLAVARRGPLSMLAELATAYPSVSQGFLECVRLLLGQSSLKANSMPDISVSFWHPPDNAEK